MATHIALLCAATAVIAMMLRMPEALVACYLIFFAYKDNAGEAIVIGVGLIFAATLAIGIGVVLLGLVIDAPLLRFALILVLTFGGMFLWRASSMGPASYALAFVLAFVLMLADTVPVPELLMRGMLWLWVVVAVPMGLLVLSSILFGRSPRTLALRVVSERLDTAARIVAGEETVQSAAHLLEEGNAEALGYVKMAQLIGEMRREPAERLRAELDTSHAILRSAVALAESRGSATPVAETLRHLAEGAQVETSADPLGRAIAALQAARDPNQTPRPPAPEPSAFFKPDAFTNPVYIHFALKVVLAVAITYTLVLGIDLFDIHTAIVTCFFVALGTGGEVFHKSSLRIIGCLVGSLMGALAVLYVVPHASDAGHLFFLIAFGSFAAGWVALGTWRTQYLGWQMALAFFICVLPGSPLNFAPNTDLADAGYRILGILLGIAVMGAVFALVWPESAEGAVAQETALSLQATAATLRSGNTDQGLAAWTHLGAARLAAEVMGFERLGAHRAGARRRALVEQLHAARALARMAPALAGQPGSAALADEVAAAAAVAAQRAGANFARDLSRGFNPQPLSSNIGEGAVVHVQARARALLRAIAVKETPA